jgi:hypothetical protein
MSSAMKTVDSGVVSDGLSTTVLPAAIAGRPLPHRHHHRVVPGVTWAQTPTGSRRIIEVWFAMYSPADALEDPGGAGEEADLVDRWEPAPPPWSAGRACRCSRTRGGSAPRRAPRSRRRSAAAPAALAGVESRQVSKRSAAAGRRRRRPRDPTAAPWRTPCPVAGSTSSVVSPDRRPAELAADQVAVSRIADTLPSPAGPAGRVALTSSRPAAPVLPGRPAPRETHGPSARSGHPTTPLLGCRWTVGNVAVSARWPGGSLAGGWPDGQSGPIVAAPCSGRCAPVVASPGSVTRRTDGVSQVHSVGTNGEAPADACGAPGASLRSGRRRDEVARAAVAVRPARRPEPRGQVVAGHAGIDRRGPIRWAHISELPDPTPGSRAASCC